MEWFSSRVNSVVLFLSFLINSSDSSTEAMFIRKMVEYVASDSMIWSVVTHLVQNGDELTNSVNSIIDDVILRDVLYCIFYFM